MVIIKYAFLIMCVPLFFFSSNGCSEAEDKSQISYEESLMIMDKIHISKLTEFSFWFIEDGLGGYYKRKDTENYIPREGDR